MATKEKCRTFLTTLLELSSREHESIEKNIRTLIQQLIDTKLEPEEFCNRVERLLNASPQPGLIGFFKKSLPLLRQSLLTGELVIDGIRPPPHTGLFSPANSTNVVIHLEQPETLTVGSTPNQSSTIQQQSQSVVQQSQSAISNQSVAQKPTMETTKEKCRTFLVTLLQLSNRESKQEEENVRTLIQELIDTKLEPEEFCYRLQRLLNATPQPCLIGFLKKSLPSLRESLVTKELVIDGIRPPPHTVVFSPTNS